MPVRRRRHEKHTLCSCWSHDAQASLPKSQSICPQTFGSKAAVAGWGQRLASIYIYKTTVSPRWHGSGETTECWYAIQVTESSEPEHILQHLLSLVNSISSLNTTCWNCRKTSWVPNSSTGPMLWGEHKVFRCVGAVSLASKSSLWVCRAARSWDLLTLYLRWVVS